MDYPARQSTLYSDRTLSKLITKSGQRAALFCVTELLQAKIQVFWLLFCCPVRILNIFSGNKHALTLDDITSN